MAASNSLRESVLGIGAASQASQDYYQSFWAYEETQRMQQVMRESELARALQRPAQQVVQPTKAVHERPEMNPVLLLTGEDQ